MSTNQEKLNEQLFNVVADEKVSDEARLKKLKYLVRLGADLEAINYGCTVLIVAAQKGQIGVVKYLAENGADIEAGDNYERTALSWAAQNGHIGVVKYLVEQGADVHQKDTAEWSALTYAAYSGQIEVVKYLAENGADVNAKDEGYGKTALMRASEYGHLEVVKYLAELGADLEAKDVNGDTAFDIARKWEKADCVKFLKELQQKGEPKVEVLSEEEKSATVKKRGMWQRMFGGR